MADVTIPAAMATMQAKGKVVASYNTGSPFVRNPAFDITIDCHAPRPFEWDPWTGWWPVYHYVPIGKATISGAFYSGPNFTHAAQLNARATIAARWLPSTTITVTDTKLTARASIGGSYFHDIAKRNFVYWSKIGELSFALDRTNDAGQRPMAWDGWVYQVKPLDKNVVVYGSNGITMMHPVSEPFPTFGFKELSTEGLLAQGLVCGDDTIHYYINSVGDLCSITGTKYTGESQGITVIGYGKELSVLNTHGLAPRMHYDVLNNLVYICDGTVGFTYSKEGLGGGPINLTGVQKSGTKNLVVAPAALSLPNFELTTNITTCGLKDLKPLQKLTLNTYNPTDFYFCVEYRTDIKKPFQTTAWKQFNRLGEGFVNLTFMEMRVRLKSNVAANAQIDDLVAHLRVPGVVTEREAMK